jgi:hypothetical protein
MKNAISRMFKVECHETIIVKGILIAFEEELLNYHKTIIL